MQSIAPMSRPLPAANIPSLATLYSRNKLTAAPPGYALPEAVLGPNTDVTLPEPSEFLNDRVGIVVGDITQLAVDAIVNAAKNTLLGGGGVDGAIHRAAGPQLLEECKEIGWCSTGGAMMTDAYKLPCKKVIHTVGPQYRYSDQQVAEQQLVSCYETSLALAARGGYRTVAFPCISTGVYAYPNWEAALAALTAIRRFLLGEHGEKIDMVVIVLWDAEDAKAYHELVPLFFPPFPKEKETLKEKGTPKEKETPKAKETAKAKKKPKAKKTTKEEKTTTSGNGKGTENKEAKKNKEKKPPAIATRKSTRVRKPRVLYDA